MSRSERAAEKNSASPAVFVSQTSHLAYCFLSNARTGDVIHLL